ncbi:MAG: hypothetical protein ACRBBP_06605 [Bdellovibrionales bacterium]
MQLIYLSFSCLTILFLSLLFVLGVKKNISSELKFCVTQLTNFQHSHRKLTKSLFAKNSYAKTLRISRASAEVSYAAAPPPAKPAAWATLQAVKALQKALVVYQKSLLSLARVKSYEMSGRMFQKGFIPTTPPKGLVVESYPKNSDSPSYRLQINYQEKKRTVFTKMINATKGFPSLLKALIKFNNYSKLNCGATIQEKGGAPSSIKLILDN